MEILREYLENGMQITEYTQDGETISHKIAVPEQSEIPQGEVVPVPPTFNQRIIAFEEENQMLKQQLANTNADFQALMDALAEGGVI